MENTRNEKLFIYVFHEIRRYIAEKKLKPGDLLPTENELCGMLDVSRNVVRESIKAMELMGMVKSTAGRGCVIREFNTEMLFESMLFFMGISDDTAYHQILNLRKNLELSYMKDAFEAMSPEDVAQIRGVLSQCVHQWERGHIFHADDMQFHMALFRPLNNRILGSLLEAVWHVDEILHPESNFKYQSSRIEKHEQIMRALEERDYPKFELAMQQHFSTDKYDESGPK